MDNTTCVLCDLDLDISPFSSIDNGILGRELKPLMVRVEVKSLLLFDHLAVPLLVNRQQDLVFSCIY